MRDNFKDEFLDIIDTIVTSNKDILDDSSLNTKFLLSLAKVSRLITHLSDDFENVSIDKKKEMIEASKAFINYLNEIKERKE